MKTPSQTSNAKQTYGKAGQRHLKGNENGSRKQALEDQDEIIELSDDSSVVEIESDLSDAETHYRIKCIKTVPPPLVTHPSHIPQWRPENLEDGNRSTGRLIQLKDLSSSSKIINFDPTPLEIIQLKTKLLLHQNSLKNYKFS